MSHTYVVGDLHGCLGDFDSLLGEMRFDPDRDRLWLVGDILNRGPQSLATLRRVIALQRSLQERFAMVLGNHEIHLLKVALGLSKARAKDTFTDVLAAPDLPELLDWLRRRPLVHRDKGHLMVHAGLQPQWTVADASEVANKVTARLQKGSGRGVFRRKKLSTQLDTLTRIRMLDSKARESPFNGPPECARSDLRPWYDLWVENRSEDEAKCTVVFGHWAALGQRSGGQGTRHWLSLDTGCVYGRRLSALRLDDHKLFQVEPAAPANRK